MTAIDIHGSSAAPGMITITSDTSASILWPHVHLHVFGRCVRSHAAGCSRGHSPFRGITAFAPVSRASASGIRLALPLAVIAMGAGHTVHKKEKDMSDYNEQTLMEAVIKRVAGAPDPRLRQIMTSLVTHLHGFVREVRPTSEEWLAGIQFLTAVGQKCDDKRQEFILLSDSLGVSMLVDLSFNRRKVGNATESDLLGPAFVEGAPELPLGGNLATHPSDGEP